MKHFIDSYLLFHAMHATRHRRNIVIHADAAARPAIQMVSSSICKATAFFLLLFLWFTTAVKAQNLPVNEKLPDSLAYEVVDTVITVEPSTEVTEEVEEGDTGDSSEDTEYFLRKEFTGSILDSIKARSMSAAAKKSFSDDNAFWYANENFYKKKPESSPGEIPFLSTPIVQTILWIIIIASFAVFLSLYLRNSQVSLFRKSVRIDNEDSSPDTGDIFAVNYEKEIDKAASSGNYRLAVRLMFLKLLRNLSGRNLIQYKQDNTNFDYLLQLRSGHLYNDFFRLTRNYEFTWYGQFEIDADKYSIIKRDFDQFENKLSR